MARWLAIVVVTAACQAASPPQPLPPPPGSPEALVAYLQAVLAADPATQQREAAGWQLDEPLWQHTVTAAYQPLYADYQQAFAAALPALVTKLGHTNALVARSQAGSTQPLPPPPIVMARRHFADDPKLTLAEARDRWALPALFPSVVADVGGEPLDCVFVPAGPDGNRWRALLGLDAVVQAHVARLAPDCIGHVSRAGRTGRCTELAAAIVDAALRTDFARLVHVCRLADALCGMESP